MYAAPNGNQQDVALASERLGELQLSVMKDDDEVAYRLLEAESVGDVEAGEPLPKSR